MLTPCASKYHTFCLFEESMRQPLIVGIRASITKAMEEPGKLAKIVSNTQRIEVIERCLGELDALEERVKHLTSAREKFDLVGLLDRVNELESTIQLLVH